MLPSEHPAVLAAIEQEAETRELAFLSASCDIAGVNVLPLTLRRYLLLIATKSVFVVGGEIDSHQVATFLWCISDKYNVEERGRHDFDAALVPHFRDRPQEILKQIEDYLAFTFFDAPSEHVYENGRLVQATESFYSFAAFYTDTLCSEYGWALNECLDAPLAVIFQQLRRIKHRTDPGAALHNRLSTPAKMACFAEMAKAT